MFKQAKNLSCYLCGVLVMLYLGLSGCMLGTTPPTAVLTATPVASLTPSPSATLFTPAPERTLVPAPTPLFLKTPVYDADTFCSENLTSPIISTPSNQTPYPALTRIPLIVSSLRPDNGLAVGHVLPLEVIGLGKCKYYLLFSASINDYFFHVDRCRDLDCGVITTFHLEDFKWKDDSHDWDGLYKIHLAGLQLESGVKLLVIYKDRVVWEILLKFQ